jgi:hypothetical protein
MTEQPDIDPTLMALADVVAQHFTLASGAEAARL